MEGAGAVTNLIGQYLALAGGPKFNSYLKFLANYHRTEEYELELETLGHERCIPKVLAINAWKNLKYQDKLFLSWGAAMAPPGGAPLGGLPPPPPRGASGAGASAGESNKRARTST
jgi:hypothetical protein